MATNITSTQLDFDTIKSSLKTYLKAKSEFSDYDFEASGLNNILDVLAYNTHFNGLIANFALNESFLSTAQLRSSVVSHAEMLGLDVSSKTSAQVTLRASINLSSDPSRPTAVVLPAGANFSTTIDGNTFQFFTRQQYTAVDANGVYTFATATGVQEIIAYEGVIKNKTFFVGEAADRQVYVIPDKNIDVKTATVTVFNSVTSTDNTVYTKLNQAVTVSATSTFYTIRESPNGFYELNFGDGVTFGKAPDAGNKIVVNYLSTSGAAGNGGAVFTSNTQLNVNGVAKTISVTPLTKSISGANLQTVDTIKQLAPAAFATQQRLVTALDYESMIKANFPTITAVSAWGSQDNVPVDYGKVYISLGFADTVTEDEKTTLKAAIENTYADNLGIMAISTKFVDPVDIKFNLETQIQWDPNLTGLKSGNVENQILNLIKTHFATKLNGFGKTFRRSALLTEIDAFDPSVLSSKMDVKLVIELIPLLNKQQSYKMFFPVRLEAPDLTLFSVESSSFTYGASNKIARIRNKLGTRILQVVDANSAVIVDTIGEYFTQSGLVSLNAFTPRSILDGSSAIKFTVTPADQSVVKPLRNYLLKTDDKSMQVGITVDFQNTNVVLG